MTPTKTLFLTELTVFAGIPLKYIVDKDGSFLIIRSNDQELCIYEAEPGVFITQSVDDWETQLANIQKTQVADEKGPFTYGGYTFAYDPDEEIFTLNEIPPAFEGTGELKSHNFGVDEFYLCDKNNNVVWGTIGGQKVYFEQSAIGKFSTASTKPQTAAEMGPPAIEASQNVSFMFDGYVFINEEANSYASCPVVPTNN